MKPATCRLTVRRSVAVAAICVVVLYWGTWRATAQQPAAVPKSQVASAADAATGEVLFTGHKAFKNGGPACSTCHGIADLSVSHGPAPGADLTHEYSNLGPAALADVLTQPPFSPMDELYKRSPLTPEEQQDLIAFLKQEDQAKSAETQAATLPPSPEEIAAGEVLFSGRVPMAKGGPACATCHSAAGTPFPHGGTMGPDLTKEYSKLGPQGLAISLKTLYFPTMNPLFQHRPLTESEQKQLAAFFQGIDQRSPPPSPTLVLLVASLVVLVGLFLWTWLAVGRRRVQSVRQVLLERAGISKGNRR